MEQSIESGPYAGHKYDREKWGQILDTFYELNGWDKETSLQTRQCLTKLGIEAIARKLEKADKLIN